MSTGRFGVGLVETGGRSDWSRLVDDEQVQQVGESRTTFLFGGGIGGMTEPGGCGWWRSSVVAVAGGIMGNSIDLVYRHHCYRRARSLCTRQ